MNSLSGLQGEYIITCPYCNRNIRSDSIECPLCAMIVPEDIRKTITSTQIGDKNNYKKCPYCAVDIKKEAIKCRYCGSILDGALPLSEDNINIDNSKNIKISMMEEKLLKEDIDKIEAEVAIPKGAEINDSLKKSDIPNEHIYKWWEVLGLTFLPYIFAWFTLRKGYTRNAKIISFSWMFVFLLLCIINWTTYSNSMPKPLTRETQIQFYKDKQISLANQFQEVKKEYYKAGLSVSQTDDFSEQMKRVRTRDRHVLTMKNIKN